MMNSDVKLELPIRPLTSDPEMFNQLNKLYEAIFVLQTELSATKKRITTLEAYTAAHP